MNNNILGNLQKVDPPVPILILKFRVLHQLPLDHQRLNVVDRVDVVHGVHHHLPHLFEALVRSQAGHSIALKSPSVNKTRTLPEYSISVKREYLSCAICFDSTGSPAPQLAAYEKIR